MAADAWGRGYLLAAAATLWLRRRHNEASIAVLPFADMSPEKNQQYLGDGLAEEVRASLAKNQSLRVAGRISSSQFSGLEDVQVIRRRLNVATILEGSVRRQANRARITVHLINASDGFQIWSETFDRDLGDVFAVEDEISRAVLRGMQLKLLANQAAGTAAKTINIDAYDGYLQGMYFLDRSTKQHLEKAVDYFTRATTLDPQLAPAWVGLGRARGRQAGRDYVPAEDGYRQAREAIERALQINRHSADAYAVMGLINMSHDWNWTEAETCYRRALSLEPRNAMVITLGGQLSWILGRLDDAIARYRDAIEIDPLNPHFYFVNGVLLHYAGRQGQAKEAFEEALELAPGMEVAHAFLCRVRLMESQTRESLTEAEKERHAVYGPQSLALAYWALGRKGESNAMLQELITNSRENPYQIAGVYAFRGGRGSGL